MTLTNAIKKANKITGKKPVKDGQQYFYPYSGWVVSFSQNGREDQATCFYTRRKDTQDDLLTDYFAGTFHDNLTQCFDFINRMSK